MKKVSLLVSIFALVISASCTKQNIDQPEFDADDLEVVFEELSEDGTKAAVTQVDLDVSGDFLPSSRTLTATLRYKSSKTPITQGVTWSWGKSFDGVNYDYNVHAATESKQKIDAVSVGKGTVSTVATYKGQEVSSPTVDVNVTDNELESIEIVGSGLVVPSGTTPTHYSYVNVNNYPNFPQPTLQTDSSTPVITCLFHSSTYSSTPQSNHPRLFVKTLAHFKGRSETKELKVSDGVSYTFPDNGKDFTITKESNWTTLSSYDSYCLGFPDFSSTEAGYKSNYFGAHRINATYKEKTAEMSFTIVFDHKYLYDKTFDFDLSSCPYTGFNVEVGIHSVTGQVGAGPDVYTHYWYIWSSRDYYRYSAKVPFIDTADANNFTFLVTNKKWDVWPGANPQPYYLYDKTTDKEYKLTPITSIAGGIFPYSGPAWVEFQLNDYTNGEKVGNLDWTFTICYLNQHIYYYPFDIITSGQDRPY